MSQRLTRKEIKRDQVQETLASVLEFLRENLRSLLLAVGVALLLVGAVAAYRSYAESREIEASEQLARAIRVYAAEITETPNPTDPVSPSFGDVTSREAEARRQLEVVAEDFAGSDAAGIARVYLGEMAASSGDLDRARELWEAYLASQKDHLLASEVQVNLMSLDRAQGLGQELITRIRAMLEEPEPGLPEDLLLQQLALTQRELGLEAEARQTLQRLLDEHPQSVYAAEARAELEASPNSNPLAGS